MLKVLDETEGLCKGLNFDGIHDEDVRWRLLYAWNNHVHGTTIDILIGFEHALGPLFTDSDKGYAPSGMNR
ncbi:hypothetical protein RYB01_02205 [Pseudomonas syringae]|nr:hypothetical protein [Pseudomonas syringae]